MTAAEQLHGDACGCLWCRAEDAGCDCCGERDCRGGCHDDSPTAADVEAGEERARRSYERAHGPEAW